MKQKLLLLTVMLSLGLSTALAQEAYAILNDGTLTFYYDENKNSRTGTKYAVTYISWSSTDDVVLSAWDYDEENRQTVTPANETTKAVFDESFASFTNYNILNGLFAGYGNLTEVVGLENLHTENVKDMGAMFYGCSSLTTLDLSSFNTEKVTEMGSMFEGCSSLTSLNISSFSRASLTDATLMFEGCSDNLVLTLPDGWYIDDVVVTNSKAVVGDYIYTLYADHHADMQGIVNALSGDVVIPATFEYEGATYNVKKVNSITRLYYFDEEEQRYTYVQGDNVNYLDTAPDYSLVTSLTFSDGIVSISDKYLYAYYHSKSVNIPKSVIYISPETYYMPNVGGSGYKDETRHDYSDGYQFLFNDITWNVDENNTVYSSIDGVLYDKDKKTLLRCPKGKEGVFVVPDGVEKIDKCAFYHCFLLTEVQLPASVKVLGERYRYRYTDSWRGVFTYCYSLEKVNIPEGVERIEGMAFRNCINLKVITMPNSLKYYNTSALSAIGKLESIDWQDCMLDTIEIVDGCPLIGYSSNGASLSCEISLPKSVKNIVCIDSYYGYPSNSGTLFTGGIVPETLTLPASIEKFEATQLFSTSFNSEKLAPLKKLYVLMDFMPDISENFFGYDEVRVGRTTTQQFPQTWADQCTLYVPENLVDAYRAHAVWGKFPNIVGVEVVRDIDPITEETTIAFEENDFVNGDNTPVDLNNTVINDTYFSINNNGDADGFFDKEEQCIVINKQTSNEAMQTVVASELGSSDFISNFTGMVIEVNGKGSIKINAQTIGNNKLAVKIGNGEAKTFAKATKGDVVVNYDVTENTYVYIYATDGDNQAQSLSMSTTASVADNAVKIFSVAVMPEATAIEGVVYSIPSTIFGRIYSLDGKQLPSPQKGLNILKMSDGTIKKYIK